MINHLIASLDFIKEKYCYTTKTNPFFIFYGSWLIIISLVLVFTTKYNSFVSINHHRNFLVDVVFSVFSDIGNGYILIPLALLLIFKKNYSVLIGMLAGAILSTIMVSWLKHAFNHPRPLACYGYNVVETARWIPLYSKYSFPSGHSTTAFCIAAYLSLSFGNNKYIAIICFMGACLTGYSRIYLGEHFLEDVMFGSILGVLIAVIVFIVIQYLFNRVKTKKKQIQLP